MHLLGVLGMKSDKTDGRLCRKLISLPHEIRTKKWTKRIATLGQATKPMG
jgi:hypothetical protein